jgi:hypothetical protein
MTQIIQSQGAGGLSKESKARARWNNEEDDILRRAVLQYGGKNWKQIASCFQDRNDIQCLHRWHMVLKVRRAARHRREIRVTPPTSAAQKSMLLRATCLTVKRCVTTRVTNVFSLVFCFA